MMSLNQRTLDMADPAFNPNQPDDTENLRLSAGVLWRLWDNGRRALDQHQAELGAEARRQLQRAAYNDLVHQVTRAYYNVLQARAFANVQQASVRSIEESLRVARERFAAGSAVKTDVLNLDVKLAEANEELIRARNGHQMAVAALNTAIGSNLVNARTALDAPSATPALPAAPDETAMENRGEWQGALAMARIKEAAWKRSVREYGPALNAFGSYDLDSDQASDFENSYIVGVAAEIEVFDGRRRRSGNAAARAEYLAAAADAERAGDELRLDLRQAILMASEARERLSVAGKSVTSAEEALRITRERYAQGAADITELLTAEVGRTATRTRHVAARYDYLVALSNLDRAQGLLGDRYMPEGDRS
jgi:outer membrane protein TolC